MLYLQNGDRIVAINSVTSLHSMYSRTCPPGCGTGRGRSLASTIVLLSACCCTQVGQTNFPKPHHFDVNDDVTLLADRSRPISSQIPRGSGGPDLPAWVAFDKQVEPFTN